MTTRIEIKDLSKGERLAKVRAFLEGTEWNIQTMDWMLSYLEETDGRELYDLLYESFQAGDCNEKEKQNFDKETIGQRLTAILFDH